MGAGGKFRRIPTIRGTVRDGAAVERDAARILVFLDTIRSLKATTSPANFAGNHLRRRIQATVVH